MPRRVPSRGNIQNRPSHVKRELGYNRLQSKREPGIPGSRVPGIPAENGIPPREGLGGGLPARKIAAPLKTRFHSMEPCFGLSVGGKKAKFPVLYVAHPCGA